MIWFLLCVGSISVTGAFLWYGDRHGWFDHDDDHISGDW